MQITTPSRRRVLAACLFGLAGCSSAPVQAPVPSVPMPPDGAGLRIFVFRGGTAARVAGHNHVLLAPRLGLAMEAAGPALRFRLDELVLDPPALREQLGPAFASRIEPDDVAATRANMLKSLDAATHPEVIVRSVQQVGEGARRAVEIEVTLHGQTRRQWIAVEVDADGLRARGQAVIRQSDFGIVPFSVLGGLLAVQDALVVQFDLRAPG